MKKTWIITIVVAALAIAGTLFLVLFDFDTGVGSDIVFNSLTIDDQLYLTPLLQSDIDSVFFDPNTDSLFEFSDDEWKQIDEKEIKTVKLNISMSGQKITTKIPYVKRGDQITGSAVYRASHSQISNKKVIYDYLYFKIVPLPTEAYSGERKDRCLLLVDTHEKDLNNPYKTYEDAFILNLSSGNGYLYLSQRNRTIDLDGADRKDFSWMTDDMIRNADTKFLYFSSLNYGINDPDKKVDLFAHYASKSAESIADRIVENVAFDYARPSKGAVIFLRKTNDGFESVAHKIKDKKETVLLTLEGDYTDYLRSEDFLIHKKAENNTLQVYNLKNGKSYQIKNSPYDEITCFQASQDGTKLIISGLTTEKEKSMQIITFYDVAKKDAYKVTGYELYHVDYPFFYFLDEDTLAYNDVEPQTEQVRLNAFHWSEMKKKNRHFR